MKDNDKILKTQLASLLSFDLEDVGDVFEPLLDFDSEEDLLEYMCALLGDETEEIRVFAKNIIRFQQGQDLLASDEGNDGGKNVEKSIVSNPPKSFATEKSLPSETPNKSKKQREAMKIEQEKKEKKQHENTQRKKDEEKRQQWLERQNKEQQEAMQEFKRKHEEEKVNLELAKSVAKMSVTEDIQEQSQKGPSEQEKIAVKPPPKKPEPLKEKLPAKGKAKVICGCFGMTHKALTNCLHCGRISCRKEGYGYCPHCSHLIEKVNVTSIPGEEFDKAMLHKERLLKFDRESTKRTVVFDDQADYFQNSTSTWLTENEQHEARSKEEQRRKDLHTIKKHVLQIQF